MQTRALLTTLLVGAALAAPQVQAQETPRPDLCNWILERYAVSTNVDGTATAFLRSKTDLLDIMFGDANVTSPNAPAQAYYPMAGQTKAKRQLDLLTVSAQDHGVCQQVDSHLSGRNVTGASDYKRIRDDNGNPLRVSTFVFDDKDALAGARFGPDRKNTSLRMAVGAFDFQSPDTDPFRTFGVSVINGEDKSKPAIGAVGRNGEPLGLGDANRWFTADIGNGPQLIAVACAPNCNLFLRPLTEAPKFEAAQAGPKALKPDVPVADDAQAAPKAADPAPQPAPAPAVVSDTSDFSGEHLFLNASGLDTGQGRIDLQAKTAQMSPQSRSIIQQYLRDLGSDDPEVVAFALEQLVAANLIEIDPKEWIVSDYQMLHTLSLIPKGPDSLTRVQLELAQPQRRAVLANCLAKLEISHPDFPTEERVLIAGNATQKGSFVSQYDLLYVDLKDMPILAARPDELNLRIYVDDSKGRPSCKLNWLGYFPEVPYSLPASVSPGQAAFFNLSANGVAKFSEVELTSTERPVHLVVFNKTGPVDANGAALVPDAYPEWNAPGAERDLQEALTILTKAAHGVFAEESAGVFTLMSQTIEKKSFDTAEALTANRVKNLIVPTFKGGFGVEALNIALGSAIQTNDVAPRFLVLGRTGLPASTQYCVAPPRPAKVGRPGMIVVDFVPRSGVDSLPEETRDALESPTGDPNFVEAVKGFPAAKCPAADDSEITHWVLIPDYKSTLSWRKDLEVLTRFIFEDK